MVSRLELAAFAAVLAVAGAGVISAPSMAVTPAPVSAAGVQPGAEGAPVPAPRADTGGAAKVGVTGVTASRHARLVSAVVQWNRATLARPGKGKADRVHTRLVAQNGHGGWRVLGGRNQASPGPGGKQAIRIHLSAKEAKFLRAAKDVVLTATQQYDSPRDKDKLYETNFATVTHFHYRHPPGSRLGRTGIDTAASDAGNPILRATVTGGNCAGRDISPRADLSGCDLTGANLSRAKLYWVNLSGANLDSADLSAADLDYANLTGANLTGANLSRAQLINADLSGADLSAADLEYANLSRAKLSGANLTRANLPGADLTDANLSYAKLSGANLFCADLERANLYGANLERANLYGAWLYRARLRDANLSGADLSYARLESASLVGANLSGANLSDAKLEYVIWFGATCPDGVQGPYPCV